MDDRVRLLPGPFGCRQSAELFEASDVVAVPYTGSSGSGVLSLGMRFGRHVLTAAESGPRSCLDDYPSATISPTLDAAGLADALAQAAAAVRGAGFAETVPPWCVIPLSARCAPSGPQDSRPETPRQR